MICVNCGFKFAGVHELGSAEPYSDEHDAHPHPITCAFNLRQKLKAVTLERDRAQAVVEAFRAFVATFESGQSATFGPVVRALDAYDEVIPGDADGFIANLRQAFPKVKP